MDSSDENSPPPTEAPESETSIKLEELLAAESDSDESKFEQSKLEVSMVDVSKAKEPEAEQSKLEKLRQEQRQREESKPGTSKRRQSQAKRSAHERDLAKKDWARQVQPRFSATLLEAIRRGVERLLEKKKEEKERKKREKKELKIKEKERKEQEKKEQERLEEARKEKDRADKQRRDEEMLKRQMREEQLREKNLTWAGRGSRRQSSSWSHAKPSASRSLENLFRYRYSPKSPLRKCPPTDLHGVLRSENPYQWGCVLWKAHHMVDDELNVRNPRTILDEAKATKKQGATQLDLVRRAMVYVRVAASYIIAGNIYERSPESFEAVAPYETAAELVIKARGLLENVAESAQVARISTLCLKVEGWVRYRTFDTISTSQTRDVTATCCAVFNNLAESFANLEPSARPARTEVSRQLLINICRIQYKNEFLLTAVKCWTRVEEMLDCDHLLDCFFSAAESAVEDSISLRSSAGTFIKYVLETLHRIDIFDE